MVDIRCLRRKEVGLAICQIVLALLISVNCAHIFLYKFKPGPRSTAYKQTWLYTAYPALISVPLIIANALLTLHRRTFLTGIGVIAGPFCFGVFISTFNLVFTCCSMAFYISIGSLHLVSSLIIILPLAFCSKGSPIAKGFKSVPLKIPGNVRQFLPRKTEEKEFTTVDGGRKSRLDIDKAALVNKVFLAQGRGRLPKSSIIVNKNIRNQSRSSQSRNSNSRSSTLSSTLSKTTFSDVL